MFRKPRVYLDYAAATPLSEEASKAMKLVDGSVYGNPSAVHKEGQIARNLIENARTLVARTAQIKPDYVTFTSGGTESNNIAIIGLIEKLKNEGRTYDSMEIVTTRIEHPSITKSFLALGERGVKICYVNVDEVGRIEKNHLRSILNDRTVLVSLSYANSEVGTIQSLHHIQKIIKTTEEVLGTKIYVHVDAAQSPLWQSCQFNAMGADLVCLDFAKCGGPKGVGALLHSRRTSLSPVLFGGGQENGLRSGTENTVGIIGGAAAFAAAQKNYQTRSEKVAKVRDEAISLLKAIDKRIVLNGPEGDGRVANNINISIPGIDTEYLSVWLDGKGFAVSTKSACAGAGGGESSVVKEISDDTQRASSTLRLTLGPTTGISTLKTLVKELRKHLVLMSKLTEN